MTDSARVERRRNLHESICPKCGSMHRYYITISVTTTEPEPILIVAGPGDASEVAKDTTRIGLPCPNTGSSFSEDVQLSLRVGDTVLGVEAALVEGPVQQRVSSSSQSTSATAEERHQWQIASYQNLREFANLLLKIDLALPPLAAAVLALGTNETATLPVETWIALGCAILPLLVSAVMLIGTLLPRAAKTVDNEDFKYFRDSRLMKMAFWCRIASLSTVLGVVGMTAVVIAGAST